MSKKAKETAETKEVVEVKEVVETKKLNKQGLVPGAIISNEDFMRVMNKERAKAKAK